jgi:hypothetical protein
MSRENEMTTAQILLNADATLDELTDFASFMDAKQEDLFWAEVRRINPTLCADW